MKSSILESPSAPNSAPETAESDGPSNVEDDYIDSPIFNYNSKDAADSQSEQDSQTGNFNIIENDPAFPPANEATYDMGASRRSVISAIDMEELNENDFADADKDFTKSPEDIAKIVRNIRNVVLFEGYDVEELELVANYMYTKNVVAGEVVIEFGGPGDAFYVVSSGQFKCTVPTSNGSQLTMRHYDGDGYFGELALINHTPRAANIVAVTDGVVWVLDALRNAWLRKQRAISNADRFEQVIKAIPLFRDNLDPSLTNKLIDAIEVVTLSADDEICRQGDKGDAMYFIMEGEVDVFINSKHVRRMGKNEFFGERALVLDEGRAATCKAVAKVRLAKLPKESFCLVIPDTVIDCMRAHISRCYSKKKQH